MLLNISVFNRGWISGLNGLMDYCYHCARLLTRAVWHCGYPRSKLMAWTFALIHDRLQRLLVCYLSCWLSLILYIGLCVLEPLRIDSINVCSSCTLWHCADTHRLNRARLLKVPSMWFWAQLMLQYRVLHLVTVSHLTLRHFWMQSKLLESCEWK